MLTQPYFNWFSRIYGFLLLAGSDLPCGTGALEQEVVLLQVGSVDADQGHGVVAAQVDGGVEPDLARGGLHGREVAQGRHPAQVDDILRRIRDADLGFK